MAAGWFGRRKSGGKAVVDGTEIQQLVEDKEAFSSYVEHKFHELDRDRDGKLSVRELQPAVADIGAALGLPTVGSSPDSDRVYSEVLSEFTHGKQEEVSKSEFEEVLSDILLGVAAGLKRDPIVILRIDGKDLKEFVESSRFEPEAVSIFSGFDSDGVSLRKCLTMGLEQISVENGMPPASDSWISSKVVEPVLQSFPSDVIEQPASQDAFLQLFKSLLVGIVECLQECPVIIAHSENTFNGSGIRRLLANKYELDKLLDEAWRELPKDHHHKSSTEYLRITADKIAASADLPPYGAVPQVDAVVDEAFKSVSADEGKLAKEEEFKKLIKVILGSIMLQLEGNPIFVSSNSVVHEPLDSSSTLLPPSSVAISKAG
ncbi:hypothetical protein AXF42_Ash009733 [Apostasia shenzhenica]|uniref:EF-hand domain-containing protein n=1 Tax=Apostasia shenzhenica TaxID=1088818 RepID=A0A2I0AWY4_9ASPA|nr:hypothetical protein AXF42_Ash009733 [Apostasia shenzhenica]